MIRLKKREKISILLIAGTILTTGFPALKAKKETRIESFDFPSIWMDQRDAVLALIPSDKLVKDPDAQIWRTRGNAIKATVSPTFAGQLSVASCTAFLIAHDLMLTSSRCISSENLGSLKVARTFQYFSSTESKSPKFRPSILDSEITDAKEIVYADKSGFSVVRLNKSFELARPVLLKRDFDYAFGAKVATINHPMGLAKKGDFDAILPQEADEKEHSFLVNTTRGSSLGGPVFDPNTHAAVGVLVSDSIAIQSSSVIEKLQEHGIPFDAI